MLKEKSKYCMRAFFILVLSMVCYRIHSEVFAANVVNRKTEAALRFWAFLLEKGEVCKIWTSRHEIQINNMNPREEYFHIGVVRNKADSTCGWSTAICKAGELENEPYLLIAPADNSGTDHPEWGFLSLFSWDKCGRIENTLSVSVFEARVAEIEEGVCLAREELTGHCTAFGKLLSASHNEVFVDKF